MRELSLWAPVVVCMAMIFFVSSLPTAPLPPRVSDKSGHLIAYLVLAVLAVRAVAGGLSARLTGRVALPALIIAIGYGAFDELHQWFVPGRSAELADLVADAAGACLGVGVCWAWGIIRIRVDV
jgi:VanZ family protein